MNNLNDHYSLLLGLDEHWVVADVDLSVESQRVLVRLEPKSGQKFCCSECGQVCPLKDHAPSRTWRHLDTMQFETVIQASVPRTNCTSCGVKTCRVPWADPHSRFTLMFEAFAIRVLQASSSVERARELLNLSWGGVHRIMERAVERGLAKRSLDDVEYIGIDEKSFGRGQSYISVMTDIDESRVLEVTKGRDEAAANELWQTLTEPQRENVKGVAIDMWQAFENSVHSNAPQADIVHDRFHIAKYLNDAVDKIRREEHKTLMADGCETLKGSKQLWLFNPANMSDEQCQQLDELKKLELKTSRAWAIREYFRWFWEYTYADNAKQFFGQWYQWASRCQLDPIKKVAKMLKTRLDNILTWFDHRISNGPAEGFNSRIQSIKSAARGFRNFDNYRTRVLFFCGKLELAPEISH